MSEEIEMIYDNLIIINFSLLIERLECDRDDDNNNNDE